MNKRILRYALFLLGLGVVAAVAFMFVYLRPLYVEVARLQKEVPVQVFGLGTVEARILSRVGFEVSGALVELNADHGDVVDKDVVLARLGDQEQRARVTKAKAGVLNAEAALKRAQASVDRARAVLAQKKQTNQRKQALVAKGTVSIEAAEEAQKEVDVAAADLAVASSDVEVAKAALADAGAQLKYDEVLLERHTLRAPYRAIIVERRKELGAVPTAGEALFTLVDPGTVWALAYVDESLAGNIGLGQAAEVRLRSLPRESFTGHVVRIGIESDRVSEERRVYVACNRCPESFHLGEQAEVFITTAVLKNAILVPESTVQKFDGVRGMVWTVEDGTLRQRTVRFGQRTLDARLEIVDGLPDGAQVLAVLRPGLREGRWAIVRDKAAP